MHRLSLLLVCVWAVLAVHAQTYNIRDRWGYNAIILNNIGIIDDNIILSGAKGVNYSPYPIVPFLSHLQQTPNIHVSEFYQFPMDSMVSYFPYWASMINMENGGLVVVGGRNYDEPNGYPFLTKIDHADSVPKTFLFPDTNLSVNFILGVCQSEDSSFFLLSVAQTSSSTKFFAAVTKTSFDGNKKWSKYFPVPVKKHYNPNLIRSFGAGIVFAGVISDSSSNAFNTFAPKLTFIDTAGNVKNEWLLGQDIEGVKGMVVNDSDSSIVYCSSKIMLINGTRRYYQGYLSKVSSSGIEQWHKLMGVMESETGFNSIKKLHDGNYIAVGSVPHVYNAQDSINGYLNAGWVVKFRDDGDSAHILWERVYRGAASGHSINVLNDVVEKSNGSIVAVGESTQSDSLYPQQGWILGLDSFGCLVPGCQDWAAIKDNGIEATPLLRLYPNPMQDALYFDVQGVDEKRSFQMQITDINGRELLKTMVSPQVQYSLDTKEYSSGSYIITLTENGKVVEKRKVVKQ